MLRDLDWRMMTHIVLVHFAVWDLQDGIRVDGHRNSLTSLVKRWRTSHAVLGNVVLVRVSTALEGIIDALLILSIAIEDRGFRIIRLLSLFGRHLAA